jgi:hypothetical protein
VLLTMSRSFALVYTSTDQSTLTLPPAAALERSYAIGWDGTKYIVVGNYIFTSEDGVNWASRAYWPVGTFEKSSIAIKPGRMVAGGGNEGVHWSNDGITWTFATLPGAGTRTSGAFRVATDGNVFVAVVPGLNLNPSTIFTSPTPPPPPLTLALTVYCAKGGGEVVCSAAKTV